MFFVSNLNRSLDFYRDLLSFKEVARIFGGTAAALTSGRMHHELLLIELPDRTPAPPEDGGSVFITSASRSQIVWTNFVPPNES